MPRVRIEDIDRVGHETVALTLQTPADFEANPGQFVVVKATPLNEDETGYYTISSADVGETFEITVAVDPEGTLGPWLADREIGETIEIDGPFGEIEYTGHDAAVVLCAGPGIGPAVGIGERGVGAGKAVTIAYVGERPPHAGRLDELANDGATVIVTEDLGDITDRIGDVPPEQVYVFGFNEFVDDARSELVAAGTDPDDAKIEAFGPA